MVDDNIELTQTIRDVIAEKLDDVEFAVHHDFGSATAAIREGQPDVVILDLYDDPPAPDHIAAVPAWEEVWSQRFCPVIIYTAGDPNFSADVPKQHPFVTVVGKGANSELTVIKHLQSFRGHVTAVNTTLDELSRIAHNVLRDVAKHVFATSHVEKLRDEMLVRAVRRRVAAMMDDATFFSKTALQPWEQFLIPPIGQDVLVGDLLLQTSASGQSPTSFVVNLTPSCDTVTGRCNVSTLLVARCCDATEFVKGAGLTIGKKLDDAKKKLRSAVNDAHSGGYVLLPEWPGSLPLMAANLRKLELIPLKLIEGVGEADTQYRRVASIDSPFREQLAWAYMSIGGRPGMPERNFDGEIDKLIAAAKPPAA